LQHRAWRTPRRAAAGFSRQSHLSKPRPLLYNRNLHH
jgi:hypothetical protein